MRIDEKSLLNDNDDSLISYLEQPTGAEKPKKRQTYIFGRGKKKLKNRSRSKSGLLNRKKSRRAKKKKVRAMIYADKSVKKILSPASSEDDDASDINLSKDFELPKSTRRRAKKPDFKKPLTPIVADEARNRTKKKEVKSLKRSKSSRPTFKKARVNVTATPNSKLKALKKETVQGGFEKKKHFKQKKRMKYQKPQKKEQKKKEQKKEQRKEGVNRSRSRMRKRDKSTNNDKKNALKRKNSKINFGNKRRKSRSPINKKKKIVDDLDKSLDKEDLFSKLNELTQMNREYQRIKDVATPNSSRGSSVSANQKKREKKKAEDFLKDQLAKIKKKKKSYIDIDYDRLLNPKHKKKATEIRSECTFQPLLSKKSLDMASKLGNAKRRLYSKRNINAQNNAVMKENEPNFQPKINQKSKFIDMKKGGGRYERHERLNKLVIF